jgi:hypothetical protein
MNDVDVDVSGNGHTATPGAADRVAELEALLNRERLVRENLAARVGSLLAENIELLIRLHELEVTS